MRSCHLRTTSRCILIIVFLLTLQSNRSARRHPRTRRKNGKKWQYYGPFQHSYTTVNCSISHFILHCTALEESSSLPLVVLVSGEGFASHARGDRYRRCAVDRREPSFRTNPTRATCHDRAHQKTEFAGDACSFMARDPHRQASNKEQALPMIPGLARRSSKSL
jgi:hypothetical protein